MDAINYLLQEHTKFRKNLALISKTSNERTKQRRFETFCRDLINHETMEEKIWYPALRKKRGLLTIIKHLISEEKSAAKAIRKFKKTGFGVMWKLRFYKFKHDVDHHATEEETELFPKVRNMLTQQELKSLGTRMKKFKMQLNKKVR